MKENPKCLESCTRTENTVWSNAVFFLMPVPLIGQAFIYGSEDLPQKADTFPSRRGVYICVQTKLDRQCLAVPYRFVTVYHLSTKIVLSGSHSPFKVLPVPVLTAFAAITGDGRHTRCLKWKELMRHFIYISFIFFEIGQNVKIMEPGVVCEREGRRRDDPTPHPLHIQCPHAGTFEIYRKSLLSRSGSLSANKKILFRNNHVESGFDLLIKESYKTLEIYVKKISVYLGSSDPKFFHSGSRNKDQKIPDPGSGSASKILSIFHPKNCF